MERQEKGGMGKLGMRLWWGRMRLWRGGRGLWWGGGGYDEGEWGYEEGGGGYDEGGGGFPENCKKEGLRFGLGWSWLITSGQKMKIKR